MTRIVTLATVFFLSLGIAIGQTTVKKDAKKTTTVKKTTPAKKTAAAKKTAPKTAPKAEPVPAKQPEPAKVEVAAPDTSASPSLKEYAKSKVDEAGATKDTLVKSGTDRVTKMKEKLGDKIKNFDPFGKPKADSTKK